MSCAANSKKEMTCGVQTPQFLPHADYLHADFTSKLGQEYSYDINYACVVQDRIMLHANVLHNLPVRVLVAAGCAERLDTSCHSRE